MGLENYYKLRKINASERKIKPELGEEIDISEFILDEKSGSYSISMMVQGLHCAACVWLIECVLKKQKNVTTARINLSNKTLFLRWKIEENDHSQSAAELGNQLVDLIHKIGYKLLPFDEEVLKTAEKKYDDSILKALAVAGFGAGNIMLFSISLWFSDALSMGVITRNLLQFFSSLVALPVVIYSSRPFFSSALRSIRAGYPNMDLAISIAIFLACLVSILEMFRSANHVYFDSAVMLLFFLLIGRYLDLKARKKAFSITTEFTLLSASFGRIEEDGKIKILSSKDLREGMILRVAAGERISADGVIIDGESDIDSSMITGETMPKKVRVGESVFAGMINLLSSLHVRVTKSPQHSLLAEIIRISDAIESNKNYYVRIADRLAKFYTPGVHLLAFATFLLWNFFFKSGWENSLMNATAVLIITCPCALALAIPIVQTIAISRFIKKGILIKSGEALEKLQEIDVIVFDKTGSLTIGKPKLYGVSLLVNGQTMTLSQDQKNKYLHLAASLANNSRHPISVALLESFHGKLLELKVDETPGMGLQSMWNGALVKLGRQDWCGIKNYHNHDNNALQSFMKCGEDEVIFSLSDEVKSDAKDVIQKLKHLGKKIILLSGDNQQVVKNMAKNLDIEEFYSEQTPVQKVEILKKIKPKKIMMIGDGINDAPSLALADVSISFSKASDISQNIADIVIQGQKLHPIIEIFSSSKKSFSLMKQNLAIALIYNAIAVPYAIAGQVVPLIAAIAMSSSSLLVLLNSIRMNHDDL